jgi:hypothetical protein
MRREGGSCGVSTTECKSLQEMKRVSAHSAGAYTGDGKCNKRGWACTPTPPAQANFTLITECTPESTYVTTLCSLWYSTTSPLASAIARRPAGSIYFKKTYTYLKKNSLKGELTWPRESEKWMRYGAWAGPGSMTSLFPPR